MHSFVRVAARRIALVALGVATMAPIHRLRAQAANGSVSGRVADSAGHGLPAAVTIVGLVGHGAYAAPDGSYFIPDVPSGQYKLAAHFIGFHEDTASVTVTGGHAVALNFTMKPLAEKLEGVQVVSSRLNQTTAGALQEQKIADNIVTVQSGDQIRGLPNYNAAEALARMPGVTAERDEGEGKYVEIRGTPPDFQHVTIDGADVPGTLATDVRAVKLDDVPADILGAIEVNKTLTADMDADAIGGSVNLVTKVPEGSPRGYASGYYGYQTLLSNNNGHGDMSYGGRIGLGQRFGFLLSGSIDRTDRVINDVEPSYQGEIPDGQGGYIPTVGSNYSHVAPVEWSEREYNYYRTRYGLGGDLDYRFSPSSSIYLKGLWSAFFDEASRWETNFEGSGTDSIINGTPTMTDGKVKYIVSNRGPIEHTWGFTGGGTHQLGGVHLTYATNYAGSTANQHNHYDDRYNGPSGFNYTYQNTTNLKPRYQVDASTSAAIATPASYALTELDTDNESNSGYVVGARADALAPYTIGSLPASFKFGLKVENQHKGYLSFQPTYTPNGNLSLAQFPSNYSDNSFYNSVCQGCYHLAPFGSIPGVNQNLVNNPGQWTMISNGLSDTLATFAGTEQVNAIYGMQTLDIRRLHINVGVRIENTQVGYVGYQTDTSTANPAISATRVHGDHSYTDVFPSLQLKYQLDDNTNLRAAVTRGIARPDYVLLAPSLNAVGAVPNSISQGISLGNPNLKPEHAWNYDLLAEHFFANVGVLSGGVFYKDINDFIFNRVALYSGPLTASLPAGAYYATQPENGPSATLWGFEFDYTQHLTFLPGLLQGIGFDVNWTHVESRAIVPQDTTQSYTDANGTTVFPFAGQPFRHAAIPRQFPNIFNVSLLYDYNPVTARITGQYTAASVYNYGANGTSDPANSDVYNYPHWQVDAAGTWTVFGNSAVTVQALDINNAVFGFFTGTGRHAYNNQREYYGTTLFVGVRQGF